MCASINSVMNDERQFIFKVLVSHAVAVLKEASSEASRSLNAMRPSKAGPWIKLIAAINHAAIDEVRMAFKLLLASLENALLFHVTQRSFVIHYEHPAQITRITRGGGIEEASQ